jgi:very-short-patch-repair endonuclease
MLHTRKTLKENRTYLRRNLTPAEAALWTQLKGKQLSGRKFIRQHSIENFIVDFYCPGERIVIELDGQVHFNSIASFNDSERDKRLAEMGFQVLRFENKLIFNNLPAVLDEIKSHFTDL